MNDLTTPPGPHIPNSSASSSMCLWSCAETFFDSKKSRSSEPSELVNCSGLKGLAEHFGFRMRKETRVCRSDWASPQLSKDLRWDWSRPKSKQLRSFNTIVYFKKQVADSKLMCLFSPFVGPLGLTKNGCMKRVAYSPAGADCLCSRGRLLHFPFEGEAWGPGWRGRGNGELGGGRAVGLAGRMGWSWHRAPPRWVTLWALWSRSHEYPWAMAMVCKGWPRVTYPICIYIYIVTLVFEFHVYIDIFARIW